MRQTGSVLLVLCLLSETLFCQTYTQGLEFEDDTYSSQNRLALITGGKSLPSSVDLSEFCPFPRNQGSILSCVGWATGYGALTIERAIQNNWTDRTHITNESSSALFLFNQIKVSDCSRGARISDALEFLQEGGDCLARYFDKNLDDCHQAPTPELIRHAAQFRISDYAALFPEQMDAEGKIFVLRRVLAEKKPVVVGLRILENFKKLNGSEFWFPGIGDTTYAGGHAMVVVGYDDNRRAFKLFNSWGANWGNKGFILVKYADFVNFVKYAYVLYLGKSPILKDSQSSPDEPGRMELGKPESRTREISGQFRFMRFTGQASSDGNFVFEQPAVSGHENIYHLQDQWPTGERFQLHIEPGQVSGYVYVLSIDASGKSEIHWPKDEKFNEKFSGLHESAIIPFSGGIVRIPGPDRVLKLTRPGEEHLVVLFSERKIVPEFLYYLKDQLNGPGIKVQETLQEALADYHLLQSELFYSSDSMQFTAKTDGPRAIVSILLKIEVI